MIQHYSVLVLCNGYTPTAGACLWSELQHFFMLEKHIYGELCLGVFENEDN